MTERTDTRALAQPKAVPQESGNKPGRDGVCSPAPAGTAPAGVVEKWKVFCVGVPTPAMVDALLDKRYGELWRNSHDHTQERVRQEAWHELTAALAAAPAATPPAAEEPTWNGDWESYAVKLRTAHAALREENDSLRADLDAAMGLFKKATGYTLTEYQEMVKEVKNAK